MFRHKKPYKISRKIHQKALILVEMGPTEKLIKERDHLRFQIKELKVEYEIMEPGSAEELSVGTALASLRLNLFKVQKQIMDNLFLK